MDGSRFDQLTRTMVSSASRRSLLKRATGTALVGLLGAVGLQNTATAASLRQFGQTCRKSSECASGLCSINPKTGRRVCYCTGYGVVATFDLPATTYWAVDTGVYVPAGQTVTVTASGIAGWCCDLQLDANGSGTCGGGDIPFNCGSVVGVIGGGDIFTDYAPFTVIGTGPTDLTASTGGNLFVQYVDGCPECYDDNNGTLTITVSGCPVP